MEENDVDRYIRESYRSYKECKIKNSVRRNSLQKKKMGFEKEHKMATASIDKEERQLRESLRQMHMEQTLNQHAKVLRGKSVVRMNQRAKVLIGRSDTYAQTSEQYRPIYVGHKRDKVIRGRSAICKESPSMTWLT